MDADNVELEIRYPLAILHNDEKWYSASFLSLHNICSSMRRHQGLLSASG